MRSFFVLSLLVLIGTGCYTYHPSIIDLGGERGNEAVDMNRLSPRVVASDTTDTTATFHFLPELSIWRLVAVRPEVIQSNVYLNAVYDYHASGLTNVTLDFSDSRYPRDWKMRLYWIEQDSITSPLNCFQKHYRHIGRRKIEF